eukprot:CAMPEP_0176027786 /NCGR_PEP_ID=MMETSP0120_2-20121206/13630_1 /TAXON_ID=160619 /ORGANISM="Kryptoperidinium foliaceum, Strain CCMP 1326" /LENGTH=535 /DNA_ID=CAMNT_0017360993 /DNA_START=44 /DNA_END=1651 /DNA_ORIENTATION=-
MQNFVNNLFVDFGSNPDAGWFHGVRFVCADDILPPKGFEEQWTQLNTQSMGTDAWMRSQSLDTPTAIVAVADVMCDKQRAMLTNLAGWASSESIDAQPILLLPFVRPGKAPEALEREVLRLTKALLEAGIVDDIVWNAPSGFGLSLAIKAKVESLLAVLCSVQEEYNRRAAMLETNRRILDTLDRARWDYLRSRLLYSIPPRRDNLGDEQPDTVAGMRIGKKLARLVFGTMHVATPEAAEPDAAYEQRTTLLVVKKRSIRSMLGLKMINRYLQVLSSLRRAPHPNLPQLVTAMQSPTRMYVQIQQACSMSLFQALKQRDVRKGSAARFSISPEAIRGIVRQVSMALCHLHQVVGVAHRDVKPECIMLEEEEPTEDGEQSFRVTLSGFELAAQGRHMRTPCGTMPFAAPEVISAGRDGYDCMAADMWSFGITLLELSCELRCVDRAVPKEEGTQDQVPATETISPQQVPRAPSIAEAKRISDAFNRPGFVGSFFDHAVPEAQGLRSWLQPLVEGLLQVSPEKRLTTEELKQAMLCQ